MDVANNLYVANGAGSILKETYSGGNCTENTAVSGLTSANGVTADGSRNFYVVDDGEGKVYRETASAAAIFRASLEFLSIV